MDESINKKFNEKTRLFLEDVEKHSILSHFSPIIQKFFLQIIDLGFYEPEICYVIDNEIEMEWIQQGICQIIEIDVVRFCISKKKIEFLEDIKVFHFELPKQKETLSLVFLEKSIENILAHWKR